MRLSCNSSAVSRTKKNTRSLSSRRCALFAVFIRERDAVQLPAVMPRREGRRAWKTQQPADLPSPAPSITIPDFKSFVPRVLTLICKAYRMVLLVSLPFRSSPTRQALMGGG